MVGVLKKIGGIIWGLLTVVLSVAAFCLILGLLAVAASWTLEGVGLAYHWAVTPQPCGSSYPSVTRLLESVEGGRLSERRHAIAELACAAPADLVEFDRLVAHARGSGRRRLRAAALAALARTRTGPLMDRAVRLAAHEDDGLAESGFAAARGMGVEDGDPSLKAAFERRPQFRRPPPSTAPAAPDAEAAARFAARAARIDSVVSHADVSRFPGMAAQARKAASEKDWKLAEDLLRTPDFIVGGAAAGAALAELGPGSRERAKALAHGDDPVLRDVGLGWLIALDGRAR